jgi:hypothetical protein
MLYSSFLCRGDVLADTILPSGAAVTRVKSANARASLASKAAGPSTHNASLRSELGMAEQVYTQTKDDLSRAYSLMQEATLRDARKEAAQQVDALPSQLRDLLIDKIRAVASACGFSVSLECYPAGTLTTCVNVGVLRAKAAVPDIFAHKGICVSVQEQASLCSKRKPGGVSIS